MDHLTGGAFTIIKEALAFNDLDSKSFHIKVNPVEIVESDVSIIAIDGLEKLYGGLYSLYQFLQIQGVDKHKLRSWMLYRDKKLSAVFLFFVQGTHLRVVTEMMAVTEDDLRFFTQYIFSHYKKIQSLAFHACELPSVLPTTPHQIFNCSENFIIDLPVNSESYLLSLGRATRKTIKSSLNKFFRDFPDFELQMKDGSELSAGEQKIMLETLQRYKQSTMTDRGRAVIFSKAENQRLLTLVLERGLFTQVIIQGEMRAGSIACCVGNNIVMLISATDPILTSYRLGFLVCYWTISECAQRGFQQCHLLWGRYQYKTQLGAQPHNLMHAIFYRSYLAMALSPFKVMSMFSKDISTQGRNWLVSLSQRSSNKWIQQLIRSARSLRTLYHAYRL
jgi:hypothetical protein